MGLNKVETLENTPYKYNYYCIRRCWCGRTAKVIYQINCKLLLWNQRVVTPVYSILVFARKTESKSVCIWQHLTIKQIDTVSSAFLVLLVEYTHMVNKFYLSLLRILFYDFAFSPLIFQNNNNSFILSLSVILYTHTLHSPSILTILATMSRLFFLQHLMKSLLNHLQNFR